MEIKKIFLSLLLIILIILTGQGAVFGIDLNLTNPENSSSNTANNTQTSNESNNEANVAGNTRKY